MANWNGEVEKCDECLAVGAQVGLTIADDGRAYCEHRLPPRAAFSINGDALTIRYCGGATVTVTPFSALLESLQIGLLLAASGAYSGKAQAAAPFGTPETIQRALSICSAPESSGALAHDVSKMVRAAVAKAIWVTTHGLLHERGLRLPRTREEQTTSESLRESVAALERLTRPEGRSGAPGGRRPDTTTDDEAIRFAIRYREIFDAHRVEWHKTKKHGGGYPRTRQPALQQLGDELYASRGIRLSEAKLWSEVTRGKKLIKKSPRH